jgi:hypothetical protein
LRAFAGVNWRPPMSIFLMPLFAIFALFTGWSLSGDRR